MSITDAESSVACWTEYALLCQNHSNVIRHLLLFYVESRLLNIILILIIFSYGSCILCHVTQSNLDFSSDFLIIPRIYCGTVFSSGSAILQPRGPLIFLLPCCYLSTAGFLVSWTFVMEQSLTGMLNCSG